ncbi:MAG: hypothetical protein ACTII7_10605 [Galactobacter sp.]
MIEDVEDRGDFFFVFYGNREYLEGDDFGFLMIGSSAVRVHKGTGACESVFGTPGLAPIPL